MITYLLIYFVLNSLILAIMGCDDETGWRKAGGIVLLWLFTPILLVLALASDAWEWLEAHAQAKTFWYYLFSRKKMVRTREELGRMHLITLQHKSTRSIEHRLWRVAERLYWKVNKYTPNPPTPKP